MRVASSCSPCLCVQQHSYFSLSQETRHLHFDFHHFHPHHLHWRCNRRAHLLASPLLMRYDYLFILVMRMGRCSAPVCVCVPGGSRQAVLISQLSSRSSPILLIQRSTSKWTNRRGRVSLISRLHCKWEERETAVSSLPRYAFIGWPKAAKVVVMSKAISDLLQPPLDPDDSPLSFASARN